MVNRAFSANLVTVLIPFSMLISSVSAQAQFFSLQEAIRSTLQKNPKTKANDLDLQAIEKETQAAALDFLPTLHLSYGVTKDNSKQYYGGVVYDVGGKTRSNNYSATVNLYNGGADYYGYKAQLSRYKETLARINSTNTFNNDTRGGMANLAVDVYLRLLRNSRDIHFVQDLIEKAKILSTGKGQTPEDQSSIQLQIKGLEAQLTNLNNQKIDAQDNFDFVIMVDATKYELEDFDSIINSLHIPKTANEALQIGLEKNNDLRAASFAYEAAQYQRDQKRAQAVGPKVNLTFSNGNTNSVSDGISTVTRGNVVSLNVSLSLSAASIPRNHAAQINVEAAMARRDAALRQLEHDITSTYRQLSSIEDMIKQFDQNYQDISQKLNDVLAKVQAGQPVKYDYALNLFGNLMNQKNSIVEVKKGYIYTKYEIQKITGILFDNLGLKFEIESVENN